MLHEMGYATGIDLERAARGGARGPGGARPAADRPPADRGPGRLALKDSSSRSCARSSAARRARASAPRRRCCATRSPRRARMPRTSSRSATRRAGPTRRARTTWPGMLGPRWLRRRRRGVSYALDFSGRLAVVARRCCRAARARTRSRACTRAGERERTLVLMAHIDTAQTGLMWHPAFTGMWARQAARTGKSPSPGTLPLVAFGLPRWAAAGARRGARRARAVAGAHRRRRAQPRGARARTTTPARPPAWSSWCAVRAPSRSSAPR